MTNNIVLSSDRELPLLLFLWKWKVSTVAALVRKFYPTCSQKTAYNRLLSLRHARMIQMRADGFGQKFVVALDQKGLEEIQNFLPAIEDRGYKSEQVGHDLVLSAFHLGDWLLETPKHATLFSEQQLRRMSPELYPDWIPKTGVHRPDGYTQTLYRGQTATFAIEVELSQKRNRDYANAAEFYLYCRGIARVLWLVPRLSMAKTLHEHLIQKGKAERDMHDFFLLEDFMQRGWDSEAVAGPDLGKSVASLMSGKTQENTGKSPGSIMAHSLLDTRKSPHTSRFYRNFQLGDFRD